MLVRELIKRFKAEWLPIDSLLRLDKKSEATRVLIEGLGDADVLLAWDSMPLWSVRGLGPKKAMALWAEGVRPGNLRRHLKLLPDATRVALEYPVLERIPRRLVEQAFLAFAPPGEKGRLQIVGSYRRGTASSGDVDLLYKSDMTEKDADADFNRFMDKVAAHNGARWRLMAKGPSKVAGIFLLTPRVAVEVDIWISTPENYAYMLLYSTGSKDNNVRMRFVAKHRGYKLNQYCLEDLKTGKKIPAKTEREIFDHLKMAWRRPEDR